METNFDPQQIALRLAVAAAVGMLIGFERESQHKGVGIRTFSLVSLLGTLSAMLGQNFALAAFGVVTVLTVTVSMRPSSKGRVLGLTTAVALVSAAALGMLIGFGHVFAPISAAIIITMLLSLSEQFSRITGGVSANELRSAVLLGLIGFVIYEPLPDRYIDQWQLINPRSAWITVIAIASLGFLNYVLLRLYARRGLYYAAVLGGLVNSTATIAGLASWIVADANPVAMGTTLSLLTVVAMFLRNFVVLAIFSTIAAKFAALPLLLMCGCAGVAVWLQHPRSDVEPAELELDSPVEPLKILKFGLLFLAIQVAGELAQRYLGGTGFIVVSLIGGAVSSASTVAAAAHLSATHELTPQLAATGAVLSSITSALFNIPVLQRATRRNDLVSRLTLISMIIAVVGIAAAAVQFRFHL